MNRVLIAIAACLPLAASSAMLTRAELLELIPQAQASRGDQNFYYHESGRFEIWSAGTERVDFDREAEDRPEGFVADGKWFIKSVPLPEDFDEKTPEAQAQIRESIEVSNAELRSVLCVTFDERTKCWDVERRSNVRVDPEDPESNLVATQDYHLYREGRAETRDIVLTSHRDPVMTAEK